MKSQISIVYQDEHIVIVNKPADMLSIPDRFAADKPNVLDWLSAKLGKVYVVHRLDKETTGIICFARNEEAHRSLSMQFENKETHKIYWALLDGTPFDEEGEINKALSPHPTLPGRMMIAAKGKISVTLWKVKERFKNFTFVEANIKTGRMHQVRIHFQSIGLPLAIDAMYGKRESFMLSEVKTNRFRLGKDEDELPLMSRCTLHAAQLTFKHPATEEVVTFEAELPKDFRAMLNQLRKWNAIN